MNLQSQIVGGREKSGKSLFSLALTCVLCGASPHSKIGNVFSYNNGLSSVTFSF